MVLFNQLIKVYIINKSATLILFDILAGSVDTWTGNWRWSW